MSSIISGASSGLYTSSPVSGCVFFGTQHNQVVAESAIMTMLFPQNEPLPHFRSTQIRWQTAGLINEINRLFEERIQDDPTMKIVNCYETKDTNGKLVCTSAECKKVCTNLRIGSSWTKMQAP